MSSDYPPLGNGSVPPQLEADVYSSDGFFSNNVQVYGWFTQGTSAQIGATIGTLLVTGSATLNSLVNGPTADFYALMPSDNSATVAPGSPVLFPHIGPTNGNIVPGTVAGTFILPFVGTYEITFEVSVTEAAQLIVVINSLEQLYTTVGRATGTNQLVGYCFVTTTVPNSVLSINNPIGNPIPITITTGSSSGQGGSSISAHLVITKLF